MKITSDGKRYNTERCEVIAEKDLYSYSNNYAGTRTLYRAKNGTYIIAQDTNGQDFHIRDDIFIADVDTVQAELETLHLTPEQEKRAVELELIEII